MGGFLSGRHALSLTGFPAPAMLPPENLHSPQRRGSMKLVGHDIPRADGPAKVSGRALYIDDLTFPGLLYARTIRSTVARGLVRSVTPRLEPADGFTIVD